jgi:hypothetical protein
MKPLGRWSHSWQGDLQLSAPVGCTGILVHSAKCGVHVGLFETPQVCRNQLPLQWPVSVLPCRLPSCLVFATSLRGDVSHLGPFTNLALLSGRPHISTITSRVGSIVHSCRMQPLTDQFSPIVNTEPQEHTRDVPKRELPGTICDSPFGACKEHIQHPRDSDVVLSSTVPQSLLSASGSSSCWLTQ